MTARPIDRVPVRAQTTVVFLVAWVSMIVPMHFFDRATSVRSTLIAAMVLAGIITVAAVFKGRTSRADRRAVDEVVRTGTADRRMVINIEALKILEGSCKHPRLDRAIAVGFGVLMTALTIVLALREGAGWLLALALYGPMTVGLAIDRSDSRPQLARLRAELGR